MDTKTKGIYRITNTRNGKTYIGSTIRTFEERWAAHRGFLARAAHHNVHLQAAWNKYGRDVFKFAILEIVDSIDTILEREQYWLDYYRATGIVYNIALSTLAPMSGRKLTEEHKQKISIAVKGENHPFYGTTFSKEHCRNLSIAHQGDRNHNYGVPRLESTKLKIQATLMGHEVSEITKQKISSRLKGRKLSEEHKRNIAAARRRAPKKHIED